MKSRIAKIVLLATVALAGLNCRLGVVWADESDKSADSTTEDQGAVASGTNISLSPVSKVLQLSSKSVYEDTMAVKNEGDSDMEIEVYAAPYSYVYSKEDDTYKLGFSSENSFTQITRWITFKDSGGNYVNKAKYTIKPHSSMNISYKVSTPDNIPAGGQYAVIFAHTLTAAISTNGIKTEASPGMVVYGRSTEGEAITSAEISDMTIQRGITVEGETRNGFYASAKVKNSGNVDFNASGVMKVESIIGFASYETPANEGHVSVIPESELVVSDGWEDAPGFGLYKVTWTVTAGGETQVIEQLILQNPLLAIAIVILLLTFIIICVTMVLKKRKERRSRMAV